MKKASLFAVILTVSACFAQVSPFEGLGNAQFFDNNGNILTSGVLYSYQAGTSSQQATYTDATGTIQNPNPITFTTGARAPIWLTSGAYYKFILCAQNDGPSCSPADVLFSVDQVPGSPGSGGGSSGSPFISSSANPATTGILRLASADSICWRNQANSANLCISKDSNDIFSWPSAFKFQEIFCVATGTGFDYLCASSINHRFLMSGNGAGYSQIAAAGVDISLTDTVTQLHFGGTATPLSTTAPSTGQGLCWNGTNIVGCVVQPEATLVNPSLNEPGAGNCNVINTACVATVFAYPHTLLRLTFILLNGGAGCSPNMIVGLLDYTASTTLASATISNGEGTGFIDSGALSVGIIPGHIIGLGVLQAPAGCSTNPSVSGLTAVYQ